MKNSLIKLFFKIYYKIPKRFLVAGIINTIFGYFIGILNYSLFYSEFGIIFVGVINNILSISFAFIILKAFVFRTRKTNWISEYLKSYVVYGVKIFAGILILLICTEFFYLNIYLSQAIAIILTIFITYKGHKNFTFRS